MMYSTELEKLFQEESVDVCGGLRYDTVFIMSILMPNLVTGGVCISTLFLGAGDSWEVISRNATLLKCSCGCSHIETKEQQMSSFFISKP